MVKVTAIQYLTSAFEKNPCWMIEPLAEELNYSVPSVRRFLANAGYYSSFTHNGMWYTLHSIPRFDQDGLWFFSGIGFSRAGTLINTLVELAANSPQGMTAEALGEKLHCRCHSVLVGLVRDGKLQRWKMGRSHIYIAVDTDISGIQRKAVAVTEVQLPAEIAVLVLVEFINHPDATLTQLAQAISRERKVTISARQIETLFARYGVKKTLLP